MHMASVRIPLQEKLVSNPGPSVLSSMRADVICSAPNEAIADLNKIFNASLNIKYEPLRELLDSFISQGFDLGAIYARLRPGWPKGGTPNRFKNFSLEQRLVNRVSAAERLAESDEANRAVRSPILTDPKSVKPRRLWDLHANRVVPYPYSYRWDKGNVSHPSLRIWAISHSWTSDLRLLETSVNGKEWPVPLPDGISLEAVRTELLNLGAEYVWLDVLCLRQVSQNPCLEELRKKEWRVDLSTIGVVFNHYVHRVLRYMNGLGRPLEPFGWDDDRHWLNRAWTLQETKVDSAIGGIPEGVEEARQMRSLDTGEVLDERLREIDIIESSWRYQAAAFPHVIDAMRHRYSTNPIDKVFGVAMMFCPANLPLYSNEESVEDAWATCVGHMMPDLLGVLLFMLHFPGDGEVAWRPSWSQLINIDFEHYYSSIDPPMSIGPGGKAYYQGPVVEVRVEGSQPQKLTSTGPAGKIRIHSEDRRGKDVDVQSASEQELQSKSYTLVGDKSGEAWVVCNEITESCHPGQGLQKLEILQKVTVIRVQTRVGQRLKRSQVVRDCCFV